MRRIDKEIRRNSLSLNLLHGSSNSLQEHFTGDLQKRLSPFHLRLETVELGCCSIVDELTKIGTFQDIMNMIDSAN